MRIALTIESLSPQLTGIGRYTWELVRYFQSCDDLNIRYFRNGRWIRSPQRFITPGRQPLSLQPRWLRIARNHLAARNHLFHGPNYFLPKFARSGVITVHDLSVLRFPDTHPIERVRQFERDFSSSLARSAHVITDCETVRGELIAITGIASDKVTAIPLGVGPEYTPLTSDTAKATLDMWGLRYGRYGLSVSTLEPRKKIAALLTAWRDLPPILRDSTPLVLAGGSGWHSTEIETLIEQGRREGWCHYLGFVPQDHLPALYAGAQLFIYPSTYEGFGLPPIEAMASGIPVIVSAHSCLPEVTAGAAMLIEPDDHELFVSALERGLTDERWRATARSTGLEVAARYRWDHCAQRTLAVYGAVIEAFG